MPWLQGSSIPWNAASPSCDRSPLGTSGYRTGRSSVVHIVNHEEIHVYTVASGYAFLRIHYSTHYSCTVNVHVSFANCVFVVVKVESILVPHLKAAPVHPGMHASRMASRTRTHDARARRRGAGSIAAPDRGGGTDRMEPARAASTRRARARGQEKRCTRFCSFLDEWAVAVAATAHLQIMALASVAVVGTTTRCCRQQPIRKHRTVGNR